MVEATATADAAGGTADGPLVEAARKVEKGIGTAKERLGEKLGTAKERLGESLDSAKEKAGVVSQKSMSEMADDVTSYAKDHPGQTILVSLGVGALIGWLISRK